MGAGRERGHARPVPSPSQPPETSRRVADRPRCTEVFRVRYRVTTDAQRDLYESDWLVQTVDFCGHISRKQAMCVCLFSFLCVCLIYNQARNVFAISEMGERTDFFPFLDPVPDRGQPRQR